MFNALFIDSFSRYIIFLLLLFVTLILWYIKVHAWYVTVPPKTDEQIKIIKKEFDQAHAEEEDELRSEKWDTIELKLRKKPLDINFVEIFVLHIPLSAYLGLVSFLVIFIAGYFTLLFVGIGPSDSVGINGGSTPGWNMADWYDEGWAWAMIALVSLIIIVISGKTQDPILPLFFSAGPAGVFYQNTQRHLIQTCHF